jgi:hypothetical protein
MPDDESSEDRAMIMAALRANAARVSALREELAKAEEELRKQAVKARKAGVLVRDIQTESKWSHEKANRVLREGGIPADRSAPRK